MNKKIIITIDVDESNNTSPKLMSDDIISELSCCWNASSFKEIKITITSKTKESYD